MRPPFSLYMPRDDERPGNQAFFSLLSGGELCGLCRRFGRFIWNRLWTGEMSRHGVDGQDRAERETTAQSG